MFGPRGNPTAANLFNIIACLQEHEGVRVQVVAECCCVMPGSRNGTWSARPRQRCIFKNQPSLSQYSSASGISIFIASNEILLFCSTVIPMRSVNSFRAIKFFSMKGAIDIVWNSTRFLPRASRVWLVSTSLRQAKSKHNPTAGGSVVRKKNQYLTLGSARANRLSPPESAKAPFCRLDIRTRKHLPSLVVFRIRWNF